MGVGIILVDCDRFLEACNRFVVPIERLQCAASIVPGFRMLGCMRQRAVKCFKRLGMAIKIEQGSASIVQGFDMVRRLCDHRVEIGERLRVAAQVWQARCRD